MNKQYIHSLLDETIHGVTVRFITKAVRSDSTLESLLGNSALSTKGYLYLTKEKFNPGDFVIVMANDQYQIVVVEEWHDEPPIEAQSDIQYKWVISAVDLASHNETLNWEKECLAKIGSGMRNGHRRGARAALAAEFPDLLGLVTQPTQGDTDACGAG